jgi:hypothetical protein
LGKCKDYESNYISYCLNTPNCVILDISQCVLNPCRHNEPAEMGVCSNPYCKVKNTSDGQICIYDNCSRFAVDNCNQHYNEGLNNILKFITMYVYRL